MNIKVEVPCNYCFFFWEDNSWCGLKQKTVSPLKKDCDVASVTLQKIDRTLVEQDGEVFKLFDNICTNCGKKWKSNVANECCSIGCKTKVAEKHAGRKFKFGIIPKNINN